MQYRAALRRALGALVLVGLLACQSRESAAPVDWKATPFGRDMDRICNALEQSGASKEPKGAHQLMVAQWISANLESAEGRKFLGGVARLDGAAKGKALEEQAAKLGVAPCPIADAWKTPASPAAP